MNIHPTAIIEDGAQVHASARVGAYSIIEAGAVIGADCVIDSHARIYAPARLGRGNRVCHGATIGVEPQDLGYRPENRKPLIIGEYNHFKEGVNISHGVKSEHGTIIGNHNYFMAFAHLGHDSVIGDHNVIANGAALSGHVEMAHHIFLSGHVAVHQFCRIGAYAMLGGVSGVTQDIPPYVLANGQRAEIIGLNLVGLRRNHFSQSQRSAIKRAYKVLYKSGLKRQDALNALRQDHDSAEVREIVTFAEHCPRGLVSHR
jgi:UDP-N-acetylglucosamine acyltransferase